MCLLGAIRTRRWQTTDTADCRLDILLASSQRTLEPGLLPSRTIIAPLHLWPLASGLWTWINLRPAVIIDADRGTRYEATASRAGDFLRPLRQAAQLAVPRSLEETDTTAVPGPNAWVPANCHEAMKLSVQVCEGARWTVGAMGPSAVERGRQPNVEHRTGQTFTAGRTTPSVHTHPFPLASSRRHRYGHPRTRRNLRLHTHHNIAECITINSFRTSFHPAFLPSVLWSSPSCPSP